GRAADHRAAGRSQRHRPGSAVMARLDLMGVDLKLDYAIGGGFFEDADLATALDAKRVPRLRGLLTTERRGGVEQAIINRLKTRKGELAPLGHAGYGSRHHELIGEPNVERVR